MAGSRPQNRSGDGTDKEEVRGSSPLRPTVQAVSPGGCAVAGEPNSEPNNARRAVVTLISVPSWRGRMIWRSFSLATHGCRMGGSPVLSGSRADRPSLWPPRRSRKYESANLCRMSVIEQAVRDGVELAAGGAHIIEDENSAFFGYCRVWDLEQSTEFGCGDSFGPRGRLRRLAPGRRKDLTRDVSDARSRVVLASCPPVIAPTAPGQAPTE